MESKQSAWEICSGQRPFRVMYHDLQRVVQIVDAYQDKVSGSQDKPGFKSGSICPAINTLFATFMREFAVSHNLTMSKRSKPSNRRLTPDRTQQI